MELPTFITKLTARDILSLVRTTLFALFLFLICLHVNGGMKSLKKGIMQQKWKGMVIWDHGTPHQNTTWMDYCIKYNYSTKPLLSVQVCHLFIPTRNITIFVNNRFQYGFTEQESKQLTEWMRRCVLKSVWEIQSAKVQSPLTQSASTQSATPTDCPVHPTFQPHCRYEQRFNNATRLCFDIDKKVDYFDIGGTFFLTPTETKKLATILQVL